MAFTFPTIDRRRGGELIDYTAAITAGAETRARALS